MRSYNIDRKLKEEATIRLAIEKVCKNKHKKDGKITAKYRQAQYILANIEYYIKLTLELVTQFEAMKRAEQRGEPTNTPEFAKAFHPSEYKSFKRKCDGNGKIRDIASVPLFPDQVIHQLIMVVSSEIFTNGMYEYSCGSIPGRGVHKGKRYIEKFIRNHTKENVSEIKYGAQLDIKKCYPNISHSYLKKQLRKKFRGNLFIWLCFAVIDSFYIETESGERVGLPIGFYTSQWFCNFVLTPIDHYIKQTLKIKCYVRYMDDMVLFKRNKKELHKNVSAIIQYAAEIGLTIKSNWQVFRFDYIDKSGKHRGRAIDFLGFRFFRNKTILRKRLALAIMRAVRRVHKAKRILPHTAMSLMSRLGWLRHCNSYNFYHKYVKPYINIRKLKEVIRNESRMRNNASCPV
ncbi:MAG: hypothetical protein A2Y17_12340 [Clostridiales bacterium GWF2_38_85]|nr:MAG: hypothetical protein A2Y17_12340 [Clostridiales bacterium GWF2_38_85]